jgi:two-component system, OmpR family, catabolic regulation response regulator CreB
VQVLLVEDEPSIADAVVYALESEGVTCAWAASGEAALQHIQKSHPQIVLLDIGLPDTNGFDLFKQIRSTSNAAIIFLTSRSSDVDQVLGLELGADDYITKPFSPRVLSARVRLQLRRGSAKFTEATTEPAQITNRRDLVVDETKRRITLHGQVLDLSRYEYGLLLLLLQNPSRIYDRAQLMQIVWASPDESFDRTVDTHIKVLRQKIKAIDANLNVIKTHRGLGYSFEPN